MWDAIDGVEDRTSTYFVGNGCLNKKFANNILTIVICPVLSPFGSFRLFSLSLHRFYIALYAILLPRSFPSFYLFYFSRTIVI